MSSLRAFATEVARTLGGTVDILDSGEYGSAAIAIGNRHPVLVRDHRSSYTISLPTKGSWHVRSLDDWRRCQGEVQAALAHGDFPVSMSDAILALLPLFAKLGLSLSEARFPGTPIPQEVWLQLGTGSIGLFQAERAVRVVVWAGSEMISRTLSDPSAVPELDSWLGEALERQAHALAQEEAERKRKAALPIPDYESVIAALRSGASIRTGGGRYHETYFWDTRLRRRIFDEGFEEVRDGTETELRAHIQLYPDPFREALGID